jgi:hypothetical protein
MSTWLYTAARHEAAAHGAVVVDRLEQEQAVRVLLVRDGAALEHRAALQLDAVGLGAALGQRQRRGVGGVEGQRLHRRGQPQAAELR